MFTKGDECGESSDSDVTVSGSARELASQIIDNSSIDLNDTTGATFCRYCIEDIKNTAAGKAAYDDVKLDINILKFLADLGEQTSVDVNSITGAGSGHSSGSNHYNGTAVDFGCSLDQGLADTVGKKYGVTRYTGESCPGDGHWHYSTTGN